MNLNSRPNPTVFPDRKQVTAVLMRTAERARVTAEQTGTKLIVVICGANAFAFPCEIERNPMSVNR